MPASPRLLSTIWCLSTMLAGAASAQSPATLPSERELSRFGLTRAWWGQAVLNPGRESIRYLTADEDNVYAQSSSGIVTAIHGGTGRRLWSALLGAADQESLPVSTNEEQLLVAVGMRLVAVNKFTGQLTWEVQLPHHPSTSPELDRDRVFIGMVDGSVYAYDLHRIQALHQENRLPAWTNLAFVWRYQTPAEIASPPISRGNTVTFASRNGSVYAVAGEERKLFYQFETDGGEIVAPLGRGAGAVFVATEDARLFCLNEQSGVRRWGFTAGVPIHDQPIVIGGHVYVTPHRDGMYCLNTSTGIIDPGEDGWHQPRAMRFLAASNDSIYAADALGNLLVLARRDGARSGVLSLRDFSVRVSNDRTDRIYLATPSGLIICLRERAQEFPLFHKYPDRRPILPEFAPEGENSAAQP